MTHIFRHIKKDLLTWVSKHQKVVWCMVHLVLVKLYSLVLVPHRQMVRSFSGRTPLNNHHRIYNELFSNISQVSWVGIGSNVYWWWCKIGQRCIRVRIEFFLNRKYRFLENFDFPKIFIVPGKTFYSKREATNNHFHWWNWCHWYKAFWFWKGWWQRSPKNYARTFVTTWWFRGE